ncbi:uncharacterized protein TM35_000821080 [Trypanosoma theileri]|uniref:Mucin-associated surface protein (MASP) n=1 Tax=Trypanosoma theileri TaxID=67003 RepID=A0A1X0NGP8_9TRYP|nr:uncharacterized protein TM35_000821080 [Trypanosoma theileri]ORC82818.1 hypothetical protein TM35_000821080 [Trypanosoma theileri]
MTTMFVQLRRVVYLLVLLHFCACVVHAEEVDDEPMTDEDVKISQKIKALTPQMKEGKKDTENKVSLMNKAKEVCIAAAQSAQSVLNECRIFAEEIKSGLKNFVDYDTFFTDDKKKKANELVKKCTETAGVVKNAADDVNKKVEAATAAADKLLGISTSLLNSLKPYVNSLNETMESDNKPSTKVIGEAKTAEDESSAAQTYANEVKNNAQAAKEEVANALKVEKELKKTVKILEKAIHSPTTAAEEAKKAAEAEQQNKDDSVTKNDEPEEKQTTEAERSSEGQINKNEENGTMITTAENGPNTEKNIWTVEQQNNNGVKENDTAGGSTNESETTKNSTAAEILKSQNMLTNTSSASIHLNVTQLSDGSSSPALVHSPLLLLLVLMCVLGCTLVC